MKADDPAAGRTHGNAEPARSSDATDSGSSRVPRTAARRTEASRRRSTPRLAGQPERTDEQQAFRSRGARWSRRRAHRVWRGNTPTSIQIHAGLELHQLQSTARCDQSTGRPSLSGNEEWSIAGIPPWMVVARPTQSGPETVRLLTECNESPIGEPRRQEFHHRPSETLPA